MLKQLSIYAENKKGTVQHITGILAEQGINILGSVINDGTEYGVIRMIGTGLLWMTENINIYTVTVMTVAVEGFCLVTLLYKDWRLNLLKL